MRNPFQIQIPCHRLLTNKGSLFGFYPPGKEVKRKLLEIEGAVLK
ncbi:MAG: MGMT family protein [Candidatus Asgardarchaeia archaeon]